MRGGCGGCLARLVRYGMVALAARLMRRMLGDEARRRGRYY